MGVEGTGKAITIQFGLEILTLLYQYCGFTHPRLLKLQECVLEMRTMKSAVVFSTHTLMLILEYVRERLAAVSYQESGHHIK